MACSLFFDTFESRYLSERAINSKERIAVNEQKLRIKCEVDRNMLGSSVKYVLYGYYLPNKLIIIPSLRYIYEPS